MPPQAVRRRAVVRIRMVVWMVFMVMVWIRVGKVGKVSKDGRWLKGLIGGDYSINWSGMQVFLLDFGFFGMVWV